MKKILYGIISLCLISTMMCPIDVNATDFSGQEDKYIKICSSTTLAKSQKSVCKEFNTYLKKKNSELKEDIADSKAEISETANDISEVQEKINSINSEISSKEKEISYLENSIKTIKADIDEKDEEMKERMYAMQDDYNSNYYIEFLFGSENFSDFFSRINSLNDVTSYEKELVQELTDQKAELDKQKNTLETAKANLESQKEEAAALQEELVALQEEQESELAASQSESNKISAAQKEINETLEEITKVVPKNDSGGTVIKGSSGNSSTGYQIAQMAVSKCGCPYYWGASGPSYFDCSGLVCWAHNAAGVSLGRTTADGYAHSGTAVSASELQAGDVICFKRSGASTYHHIGIYIGGGIVVHASGEGSTCLGNHASLGHVVKRSPLSSFSSYSKAYRRLY